MAGSYDTEEDRRENMLRANNPQPVGNRQGLQELHSNLAGELSKLNEMIGMLYDRLEDLLLPEEPSAGGTAGDSEMKRHTSTVSDFVSYRISDVRDMQERVNNLIRRVDL